MIDAHRFCQRTDRHEHQGRTVAQIARALARDPRTVAPWRCQARCHPRTSTPRASNLAPLKPQMVQRLAKYPARAAPGCAGGSSIVKASVRTVRPTRHPALRTLACAPGACAQGDWGAFGSVPVGPTSRRLRVLVMGLCSSRMLSVEFTVSQTMEHVLACHHQALACLGGLPHNVMVDTLTSAVLQRVLGEAPGCKPPSLDCATHGGVTIAPCHVGKGNAQGRGDHGVG